MKKNMLTAAFSNLGNAIKEAFYEENWEGFIGAILTSAPMMLLSLAQIKSGLLVMTKTASISAAVY